MFGHKTATELPIGQYSELTHAVDRPEAQYMPAGHSCIVSGVLHKYPLGHSCADVDRGGQYSPVTHAVIVLADEQKLPAGHCKFSVEPGGQ